MARCVLEWMRPPKAHCSCGRTLELDAYLAGKSTPVQQDALLDAWGDHAKSRAKDAKKDK